MVIAPSWWVIISFRKSSSNALPFARAQLRQLRLGRHAGHRRRGRGRPVPPSSPPLFFSQPCIASISGFCAAAMRSASRLTWVDLGAVRGECGHLQRLGVVLDHHAARRRSPPSWGCRPARPSRPPPAESVLAGSPGLPGAITDGPARLRGLGGSASDARVAGAAGRVRRPRRAAATSGAAGRAAVQHSGLQDTGPPGAPRECWRTVLARFRTIGDQKLSLRLCCHLLSCA